MINLMKGYKNKVKASAFLQWYFDDASDVRYLGSKALESLMKNGFYNVDVRTFFDECGYIPQCICEDADGGDEYKPSDVLLIQD